VRRRPANHAPEGAISASRQFYIRHWLPGLIRAPLARFLSSRRTAKARAIYAKIGGSSPILGQTEAQARALEEALGSENEWRGYVCMRYWHPMTEAVVRSVDVRRGEDSTVFGNCVPSLLVPPAPAKTAKSLKCLAPYGIRTRVSALRGTRRPTR
jgi:ferrochelatase